MRRIAASGPISLADFMHDCLLDPQHGYYARRDPLGAAGDFVTAPEISQMFGEMIGLWLADCWDRYGRPQPFCLAELGPGRGTLMSDAMRAAGTALPAFTAAAALHLVEASPVMRQAQASRLAAHRPFWHDSIRDLPQMPLFLVANEFFDALPIRQFQRTSDGWRETLIALRGDALALSQGPVLPQAALDHRQEDSRPGDIVETCAPAAAIAGEIATRIADHGGVALIVDYGGWRSLGDTFQAVAGHHAVNPVAEPGAADLTAHVDFEAIFRAARAAQPSIGVTPMVPQGAFLERLGMGLRAAKLAERQPPDTQPDIAAAYRRLTHADEMGTLFKTMAVFPSEGPAPAGFSE